MTGRVDVVVVGAGPTGLALACGLVEGGASVRVLDKAVGPATTSRALGLQPRGAEVLDRLGALGDLPDRSLGIANVAVHLDGRRAATLRVGQRTKLVTRPGLLVSQAEIESALADRLLELGVPVEWGREVVNASQDTTGVGVEVAGQREVVRAGWLVGCDGAHSQVRKLAGIGFPGVPLIERFLLADIHADLPLPRDGVAVWLRRDRMLGAFPLPGADLWRLMAPVEPTPTPTAGTPPGAVLDTLIGLLRDEAGCASTTVRGTVWTSTFRVHRRLAETYRSGRIILAGDAAHIHSPFGGQGMNTGLGDAENLAWKLALVLRDRAGVALLDTYQAERRPIAADVLSSTSAMTGLVLGDNAPARWVRDHLFVPLMDRPTIQRLIWEHASQLKVTYRNGPLGDQRPRPLRWAPTGGTPRVGDRVPDLACQRSDGTRTRLHAELGGQWAFLRPAAAVGGADEETALERLGAEGVTVLEPIGTSAPLSMLVRPDGHLAWRSGLGREDLDGWLGRFVETGRL
ncbi:FAD-dependent monooxygenase [Actinopolymorpha sp. B17G11]|uniref:FAD-dependent monooxygenase n=1 Tax=Actinopolymorpha sp. B17G11 TaxID=3160861 RepID=UPI0032E4DBC8